MFESDLCPRSTYPECKSLRGLESRGLPRECFLIDRHTHLATPECQFEVAFQQFHATDPIFDECHHGRALEVVI